MSRGEDRDGLPGISAVLPIQHADAHTESVLLDIGAVLDGLVGGNYEIVVVEYGAHERTPGLLDELALRRPAFPLRVLVDAFRDSAGALSAGLDASRFDLLFVTTPEGEFEIAEVHRLLEAIERGADVAVGYRPGRTDSFSGRVEDWAWNAVLTVRYGKTARDVECAFKLFRRVVWHCLEPRPRKGSFNIDLLVGARRLGFRIAEVAVSHGRRQQSASATDRSETASRCAA